MMLTIADQVGAPHALQGVAQQRPIVGVVIPQEGLVQPAHLDPLGDDDFFACARNALQWILAGMVHRGGGRHGRRQKCLHLIRAEAVFLQPDGQLQHVLVARAWVGGDEIGDEILLLACFPGIPMASGAIFR